MAKPFLTILVAGIALLACCLFIPSARAADDKKPSTEKPAIDKPAAEKPAAEMPPDRYVKLVHELTGRVLSIADNSEADEAKAVIAKDDNSQSSHWKIEKDGDYIKLINRKSGKVLDVQDQSKDEGGQIVQWEDKSEDNDNQRWSWEPEPKDTEKIDAPRYGKKKENPLPKPKPRRLISKWSGLVLDVDGDYRVVQKKSDNLSTVQSWTVVEVKE